jgi:predicted transcriptional regulator
MKHQPAIRIEDTFDLSPEEEADLEAAIAEADAGLLVPLEEVLRRMHDVSAANNHRRSHESTTA